MSGIDVFFKELEESNKNGETFTGNTHTLKTMHGMCFEATGPILDIEQEDGNIIKLNPEIPEDEKK